MSEQGLVLTFQKKNIPLISTIFLWPLTYTLTSDKVCYTRCMAETDVADEKQRAIRISIQIVFGSMLKPTLRERHKQLIPFIDWIRWLKLNAL